MRENKRDEEEIMYLITQGLSIDQINRILRYRILKRVKLNPLGDFSDITVEEDSVCTAVNILIHIREIICEESIERLLNFTGKKVKDIRTTVGSLIKRDILYTRE